MKKLLLLSALLIFACSSDDSSDNSNQNFLEKYDGVIWKEVDAADGYYIDFNPIGFNECDFEGGFYYSGSTNWGDVDIDGYSTTVIENSPERLLVEATEILDDGSTYTFVVITEVTNNGNSLEITYSDFPDDIEYYDRVSSSPCN